MSANENGGTSRFVIGGIQTDDRLDTGAVCSTDANGNPFTTTEQAEGWARKHFGQNAYVVEIKTNPQSPISP